MKYVESFDGLSFYCGYIRILFVDVHDVFTQIFQGCFTAN